MNRFRLNLHSSFFTLGEGGDFSSDKKANYPSGTPKTPEQEAARIERDGQLQATVEAATEKERALADSIVEDPDFSNIAGHVVSEMSIQYKDTEKLKSDRTRFTARVQNIAANGKKYGELWKEKIEDGYRKLVNRLNDKNYFKNLDDSAKREKAKNVATTYFKEATDQYKTYIWKADDNQFNAVKDKIFDADKENSPCDRTYKIVTGFGESEDRDNTQGYGAEIMYGQNNPEGQQEGESQKEINNRKFLSKALPDYLWDLRKTPGIVKLLKWVPGFSTRIDKPSEADKNAISNFIKIASKLEMTDGNNKDVAVALLEAFQYNGLIKGDRSSYETALKRAGIKVDGLKEKYKKDIMKAGDFFISTQNYENGPKEQHAIYLGIMEIIKTEGGIQATVDKFRDVVEEEKDDKKRENKEGYATGEKLDETQEGKDFKEFAKKLGITDYTSATRLFLLKQDQTPPPEVFVEAEGDTTKAGVTLQTQELTASGVVTPEADATATAATGTTGGASPVQGEGITLKVERGNYFLTAEVGKILANLNNDRTIDARDSFAGGTKSGKQFLDIFNQIGEKTALKNLLDRAKLENNIMGLGLQEKDFSKQEIRKGNIKLILLLQNIINKPGEDLYTLLSGHAEDPFEGVDFAKAKEDAEKAAQKMLSKDTIEAWRQKGLELPKAEDLQSGLAGTLYTEYSKGVGLGSKISFDQWLEGVGLNFGLQVRDNDVIVGIGLDYSKQIDLGKGWSTTPGLAAGGFIPLGRWKPTVSLSAKNELAKKRATEFGTHKVGFDMGVTLMPMGVTILSTGLNWSYDKLEGLENEESKKRGEFAIIMKNVLDNLQNQETLWTNGNKKLDLTNPDIANALKSHLKTSATLNGVKPEEVEGVVNATMRLLIPYNGADLSNEGVRDAISQGVANQYAIAWAEDRKAHISDKTYLSGASLGAFWVAGTPLVGIYGGFKLTIHHADGYGDTRGNTQETRQEYQGEWNETLLKNLNRELGLTKEGEKLTIVESGGKHYVKIPAAIHRRVLVNEKMQGLMKKDGKDVLIDTHTLMVTEVRRGAATRNTNLIIGGTGGSENEYAPLDVAITRDEQGFRWFTEGEIDSNRVLELGGSIETYNADILTKALNELKNKLPSDAKLQAFKLTEQQVANLVDKLNELKQNPENAGKKQKIVLENKNGEISLKGDPETGTEGRGLEIEYRANYEMINPDAKRIADAVYAEVLKLDANGVRVLNSVKHGIKDRNGKVVQPKWESYDTFNNAISEGNKTGNYEAAKVAIAPILNDLIAKCKLDVNKNGFKDALEILDTLDGAALGQALMSIDNIFARSTRVVGKNGEYTFPREGTEGMSNIIKDRERQISDTIKTKLQNDPDGSAKEAYLTLIDASKNYRTSPTHSADFKKQSTTARQLKNTVGFNLGDKTNPERPLFNPEIYEQMVDLDSPQFQTDAVKNAKNTIHKRAMEQFAKNDALINPILKVLGLEGQTVTPKNFEPGEKGKLTLDIGGKKVTLSAGMKFGYFTQCVNHTVILDDITVVGEDGTTVNFNSGVWQNGTYVEGNRSTITSTTTVGLSGSVIVHNEKPTPTPTTPDDDTPPAPDPHSQTGGNVENPDGPNTSPTQ